MATKVRFWCSWEILPSAWDVPWIWIPERSYSKGSGGQSVLEQEL